MGKHLMRSVCVAIVLISLVTHSIGTPLDDYINKPDDHYKWHDTGRRIKGLVAWGAWEGYVLNMTSQKWLSDAEVDCTIWNHNIVVVKPGQYDHKKTAMLIIGGGDNGDAPSARDPYVILAAAVAVKTRSLVVVVYQVPNQPCHFLIERPQVARSGDALIAYTWKHFVDHPELKEWPLRLPMTKAAIRAMDTVQAYVQGSFNVSVENFVVTGASKRGWAAWLTAATDDRIVGLIPIVMDALNTLPNVHHYYRSLAGWPVVFQPYYELDLTAKIDTPEFKQLMQIVDPYVYRDRLKMPKLMIGTSNDEFFLIDDSSYFWDDLEGEKHILILPNTEHTLLTGVPRLLTAVEGFFLSIVEGHELGLDTNSTDSETDLDASKPEIQRGALMQVPVPFKSRLDERRAGFKGRPNYWWHINRDAGTIDLGTTDKPLKVTLWYAYTKKERKTRDFRWFTLDVGNCPTIAIKGICIQPTFFRSRILKPTSLDNESGMKNYFASIPFPEQGYGAFYVELKFSGPKAFLPFVFTTAAVIYPNTFPVDDCSGEQCTGTLV